MNLSQIASRPVIFTHPRATVLEACETMLEKRVGAVIVLDEGKLVGIFSERDVVRRVAAKRLDPMVTRVTKMMTTQVKTVNESTSMDTALELMHQGGFRHLPLVDAAGRAAGMLSVRDLLRHRLQELDSKNADLMNFISADGPGS